MVARAKEKLTAKFKGVSGRIIPIEQSLEILPSLGLLFLCREHFKERFPLRFQGIELILKLGDLVTRCQLSGKAGLGSQDVLSL